MAAERHRSAPLRSKLSMIRVEALVDAPLGVEHVGGDERAGAVAARLEHFGKGELLRRRGRSRRCRGRRARAGTCPVNMLECAGSVSGATETACSNSTPSRASRSNAGVSTSIRRRRPIRSARVVSSVMTTRFSGEPANAARQLTEIHSRARARGARHQEPPRGAAQRGDRQCERDVKPFVHRRFMVRHRGMIKG